LTGLNWLEIEQKLCSFDDIRRRKRDIRRRKRDIRRRKRDIRRRKRDIRRRKRDIRRRKRGRPRKTWMEGVQAAMTTRNLETNQWRNREEWRLVSGRRRQLL